jgi:hypothetical protein
VCAKGRELHYARVTTPVVPPVPPVASAGVAPIGGNSLVDIEPGTNTYMGMWFSADYFPRPFPTLEAQAASNAATVLPYAGTVSAFVIRLATPASTTPGDIVFLDVLRNGLATQISCQIVASSLGCTDSLHQIDVNPGDTIVVRMSAIGVFGKASATNISWAAKYTAK